MPRQGRVRPAGCPTCRQLTLALRCPLPQVFQVPHYLAAIRSVDEAVVIGVALSLSSSAFVLQLLTERGELTTKFGSATLGILLAQVGGAARLAAGLWDGLSVKRGSVGLAGSWPLLSVLCAGQGQHHAVRLFRQCTGCLTMAQH